MRLHKNVVAERESFVLEFVNNQPKATVKEINSALTTKYGKQMSPNRILQLRKPARTLALNGTLTVLGANNGQ
jgi:hypothetical protein